MGAGSMDYKELSQQIELKTGVMEAASHVSEHNASSGLFEQVTQQCTFSSSLFAHKHI